MIDPQPIVQVAGDAFNAALDGPTNPTPMEAFEAGAEAATQMMTDMGAPPGMIEGVISDARGDYETCINDGMQPMEAFEAIDAQGLGPDMGAIANAAHTAFTDAIEAGSSPSEAFEAAAQAAGAECEAQGIPSDMHEAATTELRNDFNEAIESGMDPMEAFDNLEPPGMDEGMGAEYQEYGGPGPMGQDSPMGGEDFDYAQGPEGGGYAQPPGGDPLNGDMPPPPGMEGMDLDGDGQPPPPPPEGMDSLDGALGVGGPGYDAPPPPPNAADQAMDSAMTDSANQDYAPPPPPDAGGYDSPPPPPPDAGAGGDDYAPPPPPDDPGTVG